ncbi:MAG: tetratricopeptide repeat protein [Lentisphaerota bacterium]
MNAPSSIIFCARLVAGVALILVAPLARAQAAAPVASDPNQAAIKLELDYIRQLQTSLRLPDFADLVIQELKRKYPEVAVQLRVVEVEGMLAQGKFAEVKAIIGERPDTDSAEMWGMKLALGDGYFAFGKYAEAKAIYDAFFKRYETPPPEIATVYRDSAYKYTQMMLLLKQDRAALDAYRRMLKQKLDSSVERQIRAEMAELMVRVADDIDKETEKKALLSEADKIVDALLWSQDIWFGKAIVLKAHIKLIAGKGDDAQKMVELYMPQLKQIHDALLKEERDLNVSGLVRLSPMAECRYLLGVMLYDEARKLIKEPNYDQEKVKTLLFGAKGADGKRAGNGAFNHFINVFVQYPESQWAADAGARVEEVKELVKTAFGTIIDVPITPDQWKMMRDKQLSEARMLFNQGQFDKAVEALLIVINRSPSSPETIPALGDLARSYIELQDDWGADVVTGHLAERFCLDRELQETAGNELLRVAEFYGERKMDQKRKQVYDAYLRNYRDHSLAPSILMRFGEQAFQQNDFGVALDYYRQIQDTFTNSPHYFEAMNRTAQIYEESGNHSNAINVLTEFVQQSELRGRQGSALVSAKFRLALTQKNMAVAAVRADPASDSTDPMRELLKAAASFDQLAKVLSDPEGSYNKTAADRERNAALLEAALFNKAYCLQIVTKPADKTPKLQRMAFDGYIDLATRFPASKYAPNALMQAGAILSIAGDSAGANTLFERLRKNYPESAEAKNVLFEMGRRFLEMGYRAQAIDTFKKMFVEQGNYSDAQILLAGQELLKAKEYELAGQAFDRVSTSSKDQTQRISAQIGKAEVQIAQEQFAIAVQTLTTLAAALKGSIRLVDVDLLLSRAASEQGRLEPDADKRMDCFNRAIVAMKTVKTYRTNVLERALTDLEVGRLLTRKARAEEKFGTADGVRKAKGQAIAAYQVLLMSADSANVVIAPLLEDAYHECLPLMVEIKRWQDVADDCNAYLEAFPGGKYTAEVRILKNQVGIELAVGGGATTPAAAPDVNK